ncbi:putative trihelix transcription factor GT3 [Helianthus annuus]|nr:putative trihelix transcription factor GT3 [Helianthus annuus]
MEQEGMRQQFPFYNELQAIFTGRMQRMLWLEAEGGSSKKRLLSSDDEDEESDVDKASKKKRKISNKDSSTLAVNLKEILDDLMKQHMQIEMQWMKLYESKEEERRRRDMEWRQKMEALENEKIMGEGDGLVRYRLIYIFLRIHQKGLHWFKTVSL